MLEGKCDRENMTMSDNAPISGLKSSDRAASLRRWVVPRVQRLIATSAEIGIGGSTDAAEQLS
jgi:hypothetical protein